MKINLPTFIIVFVSLTLMFSVGLASCIAHFGWGALGLAIISAAMLIAFVREVVKEHK